MSKTGDNKQSLEQKGEKKSEQFVCDSHRDRRGHARLVVGSTTTCAIRAYHH